MARDLSALSFADLLEEARRRGIVGAETMDRAALIDALSEPERRGPISLARKLIGRVVRAVIPASPERRSERPPPVWVAPPSAPEPSAPLLPPAAVETLLDPGFIGLRAIEATGRSGAGGGGAEEGLAIVWRVPEGSLEGAQAISHAAADLRLRTVRVRWSESDSELHVERADHGSVRSEGALALPPRVPGERVVVAIGLGSDDGSFVAAIHATL